MDAVTKAASGLKVADAEDALLAFEGTFSPLQQGIIIGGPTTRRPSARCATRSARTRRRRASSPRSAIR
jgi:hypothetical protein